MKPQPFPTWVQDGTGDWKPSVFDGVFSEQVYLTFKIHAQTS